MILPQAAWRVIPPLLNDFIGPRRTLLSSPRSVRSEAYNPGDQIVRGYASFNFTPYLAAAVLFVAITIPLARLTDWPAARDPASARGAGDPVSAALVPRGRL